MKKAGSLTSGIASPTVDRFQAAKKERLQVESTFHDSCGTDGSSLWVAAAPLVIGFVALEQIGSFVVPSSRKSAW